MIFVVVNTALRDPFLKRFESCADTWKWFKDLGFQVVRVVGNPQTQEVIDDLEQNVLQVPVEDTWENLGLKDWWAFQHLLQNESLDGILKLDDDVEVLDCKQGTKHLSALVDFDYASFAVGIAHKNVPLTYAQSRVKDTSPWKSANLTVEQTIPYASGSFMFLSRKAMQALTSNPALVEFARYPIEDLTIGKILASQDIPLTILPSQAFVWGRKDTTLGSSSN